MVLFSTKLIETLSRETNRTIWRLVVNPPCWRHVLSQPHLSAAVHSLRSRGAQVHPDGPGTPVPSWLVLHLIAYKIHTHHQASVTSLDLVYSHLPVASPHVQAPLLILALLGLARFNLLLPIHRVLDSFLTVPLPHNHASLYFNLLLQALAAIPTHSIESAKIAVSVLKSMDARQLRLSYTTYHHLLTDRFVTLQLTKFLHEQMIREGSVPSLPQLESYLRVFAKNGLIHDATQYRKAIYAATQNYPPLPSHATFSDDPANRADTHYLSLFSDTASAFTFLHRLAGSPTPKKHPPPSSPSSPRSKLDKYAYTATFAVAARDHSLSDTALISTFDRLSAHFTPTLITHTILIRGLLARKSPLAADRWNALCKSGLDMDRQAVALGAQVLTRAGRPHSAFSLLDEFARRDEEEDETRKKPISLTVVSINDYLVALNRIARPDVVFRLWDHMRVLFRVCPDARTLSILLQAARLAGRLDDSLQGAIAQLVSKNPFRVRREDDDEVSFDTEVGDVPREAARGAVMKVLGTPEGGLALYKPGVWHARRPSEMAIRVFQEALVGSMDAAWLARCSDEELENVEERVRAGVPARAERRSVDEDPMTGFGVRMRKRVEVEWPAVGELLGGRSGGGRGRASRHPGVAVTNENCLNGIVLMGLTSRAPEIPLALAWMREVGVRPRPATLAVALVFWEEVSVQAPLVERWAGRGGEARDGEDMNEYERLRVWMKEGVGHECMPRPSLVAEWCRKVASMRAAR